MAALSRTVMERPVVLSRPLPFAWAVSRMKVTESVKMRIVPATEANQVEDT